MRTTDYRGSSWSVIGHVSRSQRNLKIAHWRSPRLGYPPGVIPASRGPDRVFWSKVGAKRGAPRLDMVGASSSGVEEFFVILQNGFARVT